MIARIQPIRIHGTQILHLQLNETLRQLGFEAQSHSKGVSLELMVPRENVHEEFHDGVHRREGVGEEDEADDDRADGVEAEAGVEGGVVNEDAKEGEDVEGVELSVQH